MAARERLGWVLRSSIRCRWLTPSQASPESRTVVSRLAEPAGRLNHPNRAPWLTLPAVPAMGGVRVAEELGDQRAERTGEAKVHATTVPF